MTHYMKPADTAKLVRKALKESFPGVKFSVRTSTYAGGASVRVGWNDGPAPKLVEAVAGAFAGSYFDGMIDYKGSKYHTLDGEPVRMGVDFIFCERKLSVDKRGALAARVLHRYGFGDALIGADGRAMSAEEVGEVVRCGKLYELLADYFAEHHKAYDMEREIGLACSKYSDRLNACPSATLDRLKPAGDDGYGMGTVGHDGRGGEMAYKAAMNGGAA
jgi:hypothetical protein